MTESGVLFKSTMEMYVIRTNTYLRKVVEVLWSFRSHTEGTTLLNHRTCVYRFMLFST